MKSDSKPLLAGNSQTPVPVLYWSVIFLLMIVLSFIPFFRFMGELKEHYGGTMSSLLLLLSLLMSCSIIGCLPEWYYLVHPWEAEGRFYNKLGIRCFQFFVPNGHGINRIVRRFQPDYRVVSRRSLADFMTRTIEAEKFHLGSLLMILPAAICSLILGWWGFLAWLVFPNIPLHFYPVILQRYTRARIVKFLRSSGGWEGKKGRADIGEVPKERSDWMWLFSHGLTSFSWEESHSFT